MRNFSVVSRLKMMQWNRLWLTQIYLYRFYIPELIRLGNDIETNPGPPCFCNIYAKRTKIYVYVVASVFKISQHHQVKTYISNRIISLSRDVETNPGPLDQSSNPEQPLHSVSLLETTLSQLGRIPLDVGGGGDCFFRAVSHQLYGTPNNHYQVRSLGIHHLLHNPEKFIESNTGHSWQEYLNNMSCEGTWADAIIIQAVANCLSLRIHIAESLATFAPVTIVQSVTGECASIYIGHIGEAHYVSTAQKQVSQISNKNKIDMTLTGSKDITDQKEKHKAYMKEYMRKRRSDPNFRNKEKKKMCEN